MDLQKLQRINLESQSLKELQDEIHPKIIESLKNSRLRELLKSSLNQQMSNNFEQASNNDEKVRNHHFDRDETMSIAVTITYCWMDDDGNRICKQIEV